MARYGDINEKKEKRANAVKAVVLVVALLAIILASLIMYRSDNDKAVTDTTENLVCVHVKGAVENSGVYYVPMGTRVNDLGGYTGGFRENADLDGVNLAAYVKDGEEIYIPFKGSADNGGYNLNTVTEKELIEHVEGIGETYARKIVAYRESHGGFTVVSELKGILSESVYEKVREKFYIE